MSFGASVVPRLYPYRQREGPTTSPYFSYCLLVVSAAFRDETLRAPVKPLHNNCGTLAVPKAVASPVAHGPGCGYTEPHNCPSLYNLARLAARPGHHDEAFSREALDHGLAPNVAIATEAHTRRTNPRAPRFSGPEPGPFDAYVLDGSHYNRVEGKDSVALVDATTGRRAQVRTVPWLTLF